MRPPSLLFSGLAALVLLLTPVAAPAQSPVPPPIDLNAPEPILLNDRPWITVTLPEVGVAIDLPAEPKHDIGAVYTIHGAGFMITVSASSMPDLTPEQLRKSAEAADSGSGNRILSTDSFVQDGVAGVESRLVTPQGQSIWHSSFSHRGRLYQVIFVVDKGGSLSPYAERLRGSLRFLDAP